MVNTLYNNLETSNRSVNDVLFGIKTKDYNPDTHVKVRVLSSVDLAIDL